MNRTNAAAGFPSAVLAACVFMAVQLPALAVNSTIADGAMLYVKEVREHRSDLLEAYERHLQEVVESRDVELSLFLRTERQRIAMGQVNEASALALEEARARYREGVEAARVGLLEAYDRASEAALEQADLARVSVLREEKRRVEASEADVVELDPEWFEDLFVRRIVQELMEYSIRGDRSELPDDLEVLLYPGRFRIHGASRTDVQMLQGRRTGHFGKAVMLRGTDMSGYLRADVSARSNGTYYYLILLARNGQVERHILPLQAGVIYRWRAEPQRRLLHFVVEDDRQEVLSISIPSARLDSMGFGVTVRGRRDRADLTVMY